MGFVWDPPTATPRYAESYVYGVQWDVFIHLIFMYSKIVGDLCIPFDFVGRIEHLPRLNESHAKALSFAFADDSGLHSVVASATRNGVGAHG